MTEAMSVLVTGASGFVGGALCRYLAGRGGFRVVPVQRSASAGVLGVPVVVGDIDGRTHWGDALAGVDVVVHCAARVHVMKDAEADPLAAFRRTNVEGTLHLAREAFEAGVRRFVFVSSIKVNGEVTAPGACLDERAGCHPEDAYGRSKLEAEEGLWRLARETGLEVVVVRPPLVYGPGVKGNFRSLLVLADTMVPLPFGAIHNRRSMVYLDNLVSALALAAIHPQAAGELFLVSDGEDVSTSELVRLIRRAMRRPERLLPVPVAWLTGGARLLGRSDVMERLVGSLVVNSGKIRQRLGWQPPVTMGEGIMRTVHHFRGDRG